MLLFQLWSYESAKPWYIITLPEVFPRENTGIGSSDFFFFVTLMQLMLRYVFLATLSILHYIFSLHLCGIRFQFLKYIFGWH